MASDGIAFQAISSLRFGVELFFVVSGWLIFRLYYRMTAAHYWIKRAARIWPLWLLFTCASVLAGALGWTFVVGQLDGTEGRPWWVVLLLAAAFLGWTTSFAWNVPPGGWSIQVEMGHYLLFWLFRKRGLLFWLSTVLIGYASYWLAWSLAWSDESNWVSDAAMAWLRLGLYGTWPFFVAGGVGYLITNRGAELLSGAKRQRELQRITACSLGLVILVTSWWIPVPFGRLPEAAGTVLALALATWLLLRLEVVSRALQGIGRYSYFMYFAHFWVVTAVSGLLAGAFATSALRPATILAVMSLTTFMTAVAVSWFFGRLSWRYIESPIITRAQGRSRVLMA